MDRSEKPKKRPFEEVYDEYYEKIYNTIYMRILNREYTEDIVQDTFVKAFNAYDRFDPEISSVYTWLSRIAVNTLYDHFRKQERNKIVSLEEYMDTGWEPETEDAELEKLTEDNAKQAYVILKQLRDEERRLISMRYGMEMSYKEMAEQLSTTEKAVGMKMSRLMEKCRKIADKELKN